MSELSREEISSPANFLGNFGAYIEQVQKDLEAFFGDDADAFETVAERAEARAPFIAAQMWLVERWGEHYPCPVCRNVQWTITEIHPSEVPPERMWTFYVACGYCGNAMRCIPGYAEQNEPVLLDEQLHFPAPEL